MDRSITALGMTILLQTDFETAQVRVADALKTEGFGISTEIDVMATMKKKLDIEFRPYKILGACNPSLAYRALTAAPDMGLLLPCNVTVSFVESKVTEVSLVDPFVMLGVVNRPDLTPIAEEAHQRLARVLAALQSDAE